MEKIEIITALSIINYEIVDEDLQWFINYVLYNHYGINEQMYHEYRTKYPTYFKTLYKSIKPFL